MRVAIVTLCLPVHGCDTVNGGAVELSWKLRPASSALSDKFVDCDSGTDLGVGGKRPVTAIRLHWRVDGQESSQAWRCQDNRGVTGFDLPEGTAQLWVTPECADGPASPAAYITPAIVERAVTRGNTVSLGAVELVVEVSYCGPAMGSTQPCICATSVAETAGAPLAYGMGVKQTVGPASKPGPLTTHEGTHP
jgi:hypothetical protein